MCKARIPHRQYVNAYASSDISLFLLEMAHSVHFRIGLLHGAIGATVNQTAKSHHIPSMHPHGIYLEP